MKAVPANRGAVFLLLAVLGCLADLATKSWAFDWLGGPGERPPWWIWENVVGFQTSLNRGALFGVGQGWVHAFSLLSVIAAATIFWWLFFRNGAQDLILTIALALITAGILGNLYDRLGLPGLDWQASWLGASPHEVGQRVYAVRDWIHVIIIRWPWPTFNLADSMLVCGASLLVWHQLRQSARAEATA